MIPFKYNNMTFKKEQLRLALTELSIDTIRLKRGDDSGQLIDKYVERIAKIFEVQAKIK